MNSSTIFVNPYDGVEIKKVKVNNKKRNQLEAIDPDERVQFREHITEFLAPIIRHHTDALNAEALELQQNIEQTYQVISTVDFFCGAGV